MTAFEQSTWRGASEKDQTCPNVGVVIPTHHLADVLKSGGLGVELCVSVASVGRRLGVCALAVAHVVYGHVEEALNLRSVQVHRLAKRRGSQPDDPAGQLLDLRPPTMT